MKPSQYFNRDGYCFGRKKTAAEYRFAQARDFAVFVNLDKPVFGEARNFQPNRVRSNINGGKGRHGGRQAVYRRKVKSWEKCETVYAFGYGIVLNTIVIPRSSKQRFTGIRRLIVGECFGA